MASRVQFPNFKAFDINADLLVGGLLYTYDPGTLNPKVTYSDAAETSPHTNPIVLDSLGETEVFISGLTKFVLHDADDAPIDTWNNIDGSPRSDLADTTDPSNGDAMIGVKSILTGSSARTQHDKNEDTLSAKDFGAVCNSVDDDTAAVQATVAALPATGGTIILPRGCTIPDWNVIVFSLSKPVLFENQTEAETIYNGISIKPGKQGLGHIVVQNKEDGLTRLYVQPKENPLGEMVTTAPVTSMTIFLDAYDDQAADSNWTGPHYRDGGVSAFAQGASPISSLFSPAGYILFNAKTGGNWWPFRPAAGLSVSEVPTATAMGLQPSPALLGPTAAGGGVYQSQRWTPGHTYVSGDIAHSYGRVYEVTTGGVSGIVPPMHDGVSGARADAYDAGLLTTVGTFSGTTGVITGITQASPGVITTSAVHGLTVDDVVYIRAVVGMVELNDKVYKVNSVPTTSSLSLKTIAGVAVDTTGYTAYTSGGTVLKGYYYGTDSGAVVQYALMQQMLPTTMDSVLMLGRSDNNDPMLSLGHGTQVIDEMWVKEDTGINFCTSNADGSATATGLSVKSDNSGDLYIGDSTGMNILVSETSGVKFQGSQVSFGETVKADLATTHDISTSNIVKFNDSGATSFTGFTSAKQGQIIHLLGNNANTTLVNGANLKTTTGGNIVMANDKGYTFVMRTGTEAQMMG